MRVLLFTFSGTIPTMTPETVKCCGKGCTNQAILPSRYCRPCRNRSTAKWPASHPPTPEQQKKANARSYLHTYVKRGTVIKPSTCQKCGSSIDIQAHHHDYDKPLDVVWLCRSCHRDHHDEEHDIRMRELVEETRRLYREGKLIIPAGHRGGLLRLVREMKAQGKPATS